MVGGGTSGELSTSLRVLGERMETRQGWKQLSASIASKRSLFRLQGARSRAGILLQRSWELNSTGRRWVSRPGSLRGAGRVPATPTRMPMSAKRAWLPRQTRRRDCEGEQVQTKRLVPLAVHRGLRSASVQCRRCGGCRSQTHLSSLLRSSGSHASPLRTQGPSPAGPGNRPLPAGWTRRACRPPSGPTLRSCTTGSQRVRYD